MGAYVLDAMRYKEGAFLASWLAMAAANLAMVYSLLTLRTEWPLTLALLIFLLNGVTLFLTGARARGRGGGRGGGTRASTGERERSSSQLVAALRPLLDCPPPPNASPPPRCCRPLGHAAVQVHPAAVPRGGDGV